MKIVFANEENGNAIGWTSIAFWLLLNCSTHAFRRSPRPASLKVTAANVMTSFVCANAVVGTHTATSVATKSAEPETRLLNHRFMYSS